MPLEYKSGLSYQRPEDVDGKQGDGESDQAHGLQSALQLQVVLGSPQTQPARDGCQGGDEKETGHVTQQSALLTPRARVLQPLGNDKIQNWDMQKVRKVSSWFPIFLTSRQILMKV